MCTMVIGYLSWRYSVDRLYIISTIMSLSVTVFMNFAPVLSRMMFSLMYIIYPAFLHANSSVVVVYHVTIAAIGHGLLKKFGNRLRYMHCRATYLVRTP